MTPPPPTLALSHWTTLSEQEEPETNIYRKKTSKKSVKCSVFWKFTSQLVASFTVSHWWKVLVSSPQRGVVGVEAVVGTVTGCSPRSRDGVSSRGGGLFFWASSFSVSWVYSSFTGSLLCGESEKRKFQYNTWNCSVLKLLFEMITWIDAIF